MELLESQKLSFSIFPVRKGLNKIKKLKNHSKPPKLLWQSFFKKFQQKANFFLVFHWKFNPFASWNPLCGSYYWPIFEQQYHKNDESNGLHNLFFKEYLRSFLMICSLIDFEFMVLRCWCLKFVELLESQKSSFSIYPVLKGLIDSCTDCGITVKLRNIIINVNIVCQNSIWLTCTPDEQVCILITKLRKLSASIKIKLSGEKLVLQMYDQIRNKMYCVKQVLLYRKDNTVHLECAVASRFDSTHMSALEGFLVAVIKDSLKDTNTYPITPPIQMHLKIFKVQWKPHLIFLSWVELKGNSVCTVGLKLDMWLKSPYATWSKF